MSSHNSHLSSKKNKNKGRDRKMDRGGRNNSRFLRNPPPRNNGTHFDPYNVVDWTINWDNATWGDWENWPTTDTYCYYVTCTNGTNSYLNCSPGSCNNCQIGYSNCEGMVDHIQQIDPDGWENLLCGSDGANYISCHCDEC